MSTVSFDNLGNVIKDSSDRAYALLQLVTQFFAIDGSSGNVTITDENKIRQAFITSFGAGAAGSADSFIAMLQGGYAMFRATGPVSTSPSTIRLPGGITGPVRTSPLTPPPLSTGAPSSFAQLDCIPWRALFHAPSLSGFDMGVWNSLGINSGDSVAQIQNALQKFSNAPAYVTASQTATALQNWVGLSNGRRSGMLIPVGGATPREPAEPDDPKTPPPADPTPTPIIPSNVVNAAVALAEKAAPLLANGSWSIETWPLPKILGFEPPPFSVGPKVRLSRASADIIEDALIGTASGAILKVIAARAFTFPAFLGSIGGWAGLAMLHFCFNWGLMIKWNKGHGGVDLIHFWPWNSALSGGLVNGYAVGF